MKHNNCVNYINLDCEKGMCALSKVIVPIDGEEAMPARSMKQLRLAGNCQNFENPDKYGIGTCKGFCKENWAYSTCGVFSCETTKNKK